VYSTSLLLFLFAAAAGAHGLYNFQVSATGWFPLLPRELCRCVFHVSPPLPLCGCCWHTWAIYTIFRYSAAGLVPRLLRELCLCVFHVPSPLPLCCGCWCTWTIQFSGKCCRVVSTSAKGAVSVCIPSLSSSSSLWLLLAHMGYIYNFQV